MKLLIGASSSCSNILSVGYAVESMTDQDTASPNIVNFDMNRSSKQEECVVAEQVSTTTEVLSRSHDPDEMALAMGKKPDLDSSLRKEG